MTTVVPPSLKRIRCASVPDLPHASWTNAWCVGNEVVLSGMTAHPLVQQAHEREQPLTVYEETLAVLGKIEALLQAAGGHRHQVVKTVVYVTDIAFKDEVGRARHDFFAGYFPCSTLLAVQSLVFPSLRVEIDAWARLDVDLRLVQE